MVDLSEVLKRLPDLGNMAPALKDVRAARTAVAPFIAGDSVAAVAEAVAQAQQRGVGASVQYLPEPGSEAASRLLHLQLISALGEADLAAGTDLTIDLSLLGVRAPQATAGDRTDLRATLGAAEAAGMTVTLSGLSSTTVDAGLELLAELAPAHPDLGVTLAAQLHRSEADCRQLAETGTRVRLVKRGPREAGDAVLSSAHDVDKAYVRCLRQLIEGGARTWVATEDPRMLEITGALAERADDPAEPTFLFRRGLEPADTARLVAEGARIVILEPFGPGWVDYVAAQIAPSAASVGKAARSALGVGRGSGE